MKAPNFEPCEDDGRARQQYACDGHHPRNFYTLLGVGRCMVYEGGYGHAEARDMLARTNFWTGWTGTLPTPLGDRGERVGCDEDGNATYHTDDGGNPLVCEHLRPTTWAQVAE